MRYLEEEGHRRTEPAEWLGLLAGLALRDLWRQAGLTRADEPRAGLFLSLPPARPGWDASAKDPFTYHFWSTQDRTLEHPAIALGDIGAASGAALVALAVQYLRGKHRDRKRALVWTAGDDGDRRALLLEKAAAPEEDPWG